MDYKTPQWEVGITNLSEMMMMMSNKSDETIIIQPLCLCTLFASFCYYFSQELPSADEMVRRER